MEYLDTAGLRHLWGRIRTALCDKQDRLAGTPGQTIGFDAAGEAVAQIGWSNPNLLDNWYFADPIDQRGKGGYTGQGYGIDRWSGGTYTLRKGHLELSEGMMCQRCQYGTFLVGKTVTFSVLRSDGRLAVHTFKVPPKNMDSVGSEGVTLAAGLDAAHGDMISSWVRSRPWPAKMERGAGSSATRRPTNCRSWRNARGIKWSLATGKLPSPTPLISAPDMRSMGRWRDFSSIRRCRCIRSQPSSWMGSASRMA